MGDRAPESAHLSQFATAVQGAFCGKKDRLLCLLTDIQ